jgi:hypothetical protein
VGKRHAASRERRHHIESLHALVSFASFHVGCFLRTAAGVVFFVRTTAISSS